MCCIFNNIKKCIFYRPVYELNVMEWDLNIDMNKYMNTFVFFA